MNKMNKWLILLILFVLGIIAFLLAFMKQYGVNDSVEKVKTEYISASAYEACSVTEPTPYIPQDLYEEGKYDEKYDLEEVCTLAALIYCEGRDMCFKAIVYIISVVLNRVNSPLFPDNIIDVVYQKGQYEPALKGTINKYIQIYLYNDTSGISDEELEELERIFEIVKYILEIGSQLPSNVLYQSTFPQGDGVYEVVDEEYFCYVNE